MTVDEEQLLSKYREIKDHGWGELRIHVQRKSGKVQTSIVGGISTQFFIE